MSTLTPLRDALNHVSCRILIGSSGSFDTLYNVSAGLSGRPELDIQAVQATFTLPDVLPMLAILEKSTKLERLLMPGMLEMRADTLHVSALQIRILLEYLPIESMLLSTFALKEGVWKSVQEPQCPWRASWL